MWPKWLNGASFGRGDLWADRSRLSWLSFCCQPQPWLTAQAFLFREKRMGWGTHARPIQPPAHDPTWQRDPVLASQGLSPSLLPAFSCHSLHQRNPAEQLL